MTKPPLDAAPWSGWIEHVCSAVGVDPERVDVAAIHELTGEVAAVYQRPMAPVAAHLWGLARAANPSADPALMQAAILAAATQSGKDPARRDVASADPARRDAAGAAASGTQREDC